MGEIPHCELQKYHNKAVRESPEYRLALQIDEMRMELEPALATPEIRDIPQELSERLDRVEQRLLTYPLKNEFAGEVRHIHGQLHEHIAKSGRKQKEYKYK